MTFRVSVKPENSHLHLGLWRHRLHHHVTGKKRLPPCTNAWCRALPSA